MLTAHSCLQLHLKCTTRGSPAAFVPYCPTPALWPKRKRQCYLAGTRHKQVAICLLLSYHTHCVLTKVLSDHSTDRLYVISHHFCIYSNMHTVIKAIKCCREEKWGSSNGIESDSTVNLLVPVGLPLFKSDVIASTHDGVPARLREEKKSTSLIQVPRLFPSM